MATATPPQPPRPLTMWPELVQAIDAASGVYQTNMETLRRLEGAQRLGPTVLDAITSRLTEFGIGHLPVVLPVRADDRVLLYRRGTMASEVIRAVTEGLQGSVADTAATALRSVNEPAEEAIPAADVAAKATEAMAALRALITATEPPPEPKKRRRRL